MIFYNNTYKKVEKRRFYLIYLRTRNKIINMCLSSTFGVSPIIVLKEYEAELLGKIETYLSAEYPEESILVKERFRCLKGLGDAISQYPSILSIESIRGMQRDKDTLVKALSNFTSASHLFHIPTRIVAIRSFLVAKFNAFSLVSLIVHDIDAFYIPLRSVLLSIICILMAEEVYFACLDDPTFPYTEKVELANELLEFWDHGNDLQAVSHFPTLERLWTIRDKLPPIFGTMEGASETVRLSMDMDEKWHNFLKAETDNEETKWALEEFLFGLSYEQISNVRSSFARFGISVVGYKDINSYISGSPTYGVVKNSDPRTIYDFYVERKDAATFRKRLSAPGPKKTLEELYLRYLITSDKKVVT